MRKSAWISVSIVIAGAAGLTGFGTAGQEAAGDGWTSTFPLDRAELSSTGSNPYFVLEPGYQLEFEGDGAHLVISVLDETKVVDGVETRVVEERESEDGELVEVSRNFFAISKRTNSVFYFGEEVDDYEGGKVTGHGGQWLAGEKGAKFGLVMPGEILLQGRYYQEIAPGVAMDRAEILSMEETIETPAGKFEHCLKTLETTPLKPREREHKLYAHGVGLLRDGAMVLVRYGKRGKTER